MKYEPASTLKLATVRPTAEPPYHELTAVAPMKRVKRVKGPLSFRGASSSVTNKAAENTRSPRTQRAHHASAIPKPPRSPRLARVGLVTPPHRSRCGARTGSRNSIVPSAACLQLKQFPVWQNTGDWSANSILSTLSTAC